MNQLKPYLLRATRDWCLDNGLTPHLLVDATAAGVVVPMNHVEDGKIVLNTHPRSIQAFDIDDGGVRFAARFGGKEFFVEAPLNAVLAIYAKENGQGITFPPEAAAMPMAKAGTPPSKEPPPAGKPPRKGPALKIVK